MRSNILRPVRVFVLGTGAALAVGVPVAITLVLFFTKVPVETSNRWWDGSLWLLAGTWLVFGLDLVLDRSRDLRARLAWAFGLVFAWPLALPLYALEAHAPSPLRPLGAPRSAQREKIEAAIHYLDGEGANKEEIGSRFYRIAWSLGVLLPPPAFLSLRQRLRLEGVTMAGLISILHVTLQIFWDSVSSDALFDFLIVFLFPLFSSLLMSGLVAATHLLAYRRLAERLGLVTWDEVLAKVGGPRPAPVSLSPR